MQSSAKSSPPATASSVLRPTVMLWSARVLWLVVAVGGGAGFGDALSDRSRAVQLTGTSLAWLGWAAVAVALAVPSAIGLTVTRMLTPIALVAAVVATVSTGVSTSTVISLVSTSLAVLATGSGEFGTLMVQASAYGDEQRFLLRPPAAFALPAAVSWTLMCAALIAGPLTLAARNWLVGIPVTAVALALGAVLVPRFHRLTRRWVVLVPAGFVLHDHVVLAETVMFPSRIIARAALAPSDTRAADLTGPAGGHAVEVTLTETTTVVLAGTRALPQGTALHVLAFFVTPTRPGLLLQAAAGRGIPIG